MVKTNETYRIVKMNKSFKKAIKNIMMNSSDISQYNYNNLINDKDSTNFEPKLTSSPFKKSHQNLSKISTSTKSSSVYYGENNLHLSLSRVYLESTTNSQTLKYKKSLTNNVEKRRGGYRMLSNNYLNEINADQMIQKSDNRSNENLGFETLINSNSNNPFSQPSKVIDSLEFETMPSESLFQSFNVQFNKDLDNKNQNFYSNQKLNFELGLNNMNKNNNVECGCSNYLNSYISSIFNENKTSSTTTTFFSNKYLIRNSQSVESLNTSSSSSSASCSIAHSQSFASSVFNVKMASTPKVKLNKQKKVKEDSTSFCEHCANEQRKMMKLIKKQQNRLDKFQKVTTDRQQVAISGKKRRRVNDSDNMMKLKKIKLNSKKKEMVVVDCDATSNELLNCNNYFKHLIKKQAHGLCGPNTEKQAKIIKVKKSINNLRHQFKNDLVNVSTSTKKMNTSDSICEENNKKQKVVKRKSTSNKKYNNNMIIDELKRKHLNHHDMILNNQLNTNIGNNYFQSACLNKFNEFGQIQVWYV